MIDDALTPKGREHYMLKCSGCGRKRTRIAKSGGEAYVCTNRECGLHTSMALVGAEEEAIGIEGPGWAVKA